MKIMILDAARDDLVAAYQFYEKQCIGLGTYFLDSLYSDIDSLRFYAGIHSIYFGYYRCLSKRFPFAIYYNVKDDTAWVQAILDCRRNPAWIQKRLC